MTFCGYEIQTHKNSKERLFIMTRTHTINKRFCFVFKFILCHNKKYIKKHSFEPFCVWVLF